MNNWKKIKHSTSFRRKVSKNFKQILNSVPSDSSTRIMRGHNLKIRSQCHVKKIISTADASPCNVLEDVPTKPYVEENAETTDEDTEYNNKWLIELDDDNSVIYEETLYQKNDRLRNELRKWACDFNITQRSLKQLIGIINHRLPNILPVDPRTLLGTPITILIQQMGEGYYWHQGLKCCLMKCLENLRTLSSISINISMDGLPIYKSSKDEFWPILFNIFEVPKLQPMVIGIYSGKGKPSNAEEFLIPFVEEAKPILEDGLTLENGQILQVRIRCFISDSPARAFIKGKCTQNFF